MQFIQMHIILNLNLNKLLVYITKIISFNIIFSLTTKKIKKKKSIETDMTSDLKF